VVEGGRQVLGVAIHKVQGLASIELSVTTLPAMTLQPGFLAKCAPLSGMAGVTSQGDYYSQLY